MIPGDLYQEHSANLVVRSVESRPCGHRRCRGAFTPVELLLVVAILVLVAILHSVFAQARDASRRTNCLSNLPQLALAHESYVQDYDETLPAWFLPGAAKLITWPVYFGGYYGYYWNPQVLRHGFVPPVEMIRPPCLADYAMLTWGPTGDGSRYDPHSRWPGSEWRAGELPRPMRLAEVRRPAETAQFADGFTCIEETAIDSQHQGNALLVAFVDGHARRVSHREWWQVDRDEEGYFYHLGSADR